MHGNAAKLLRERRLELELTQHEVAVRAGIRDYDVSRWERGATKSLPLLGAWKISKALGIDLETLADALLADERRPESFSSSGENSGPVDRPSAIREIAEETAASEPPAGRQSRRQPRRRPSSPPGSGSSE